MKVLARVCGSIATLYLVSVLLTAAAFGVKPVSVVQSAYADSSSSAAVAVKAEKVKQDVNAEAAEVDESIVEEVADKIPDWVEVMSALFLLAGAITAVTPTPKDNAVLIVVRKFFDILALNVGGAKNAAAERNKNKLS